jgi:hypothetical protein
VKTTAIIFKSLLIQNSVKPWRIFGDMFSGFEIAEEFSINDAASLGFQSEKYLSSCIKTDRDNELLVCCILVSCAIE